MLNSKNQIQQLQQKYQTAESKWKSSESEKHELQKEINVLRDEYDRFKKEQSNINKRLLEQLTQFQSELDRTKPQIVTNKKNNQQQIKQVPSKIKPLQQDCQTKQLDLNNDLLSDSSQKREESAHKNSLSKNIQTIKSSLYKVYISVKNGLWHHIYLSCFVAILLIYIVAVSICDNISPAAQTYVSSEQIAILIIALVLEWVIVIVQSRMLFSYIFLADMEPILCLYLGKIVAFSNIYLLMFAITESVFSLPTDLRVAADKNPFSMKLAATFITYSVSCQTLTGISSISPKAASAEMFTATQVLLFGVGYGMFILAVAVLRFAEPDEEQIGKYKSFEKQTQDIAARAPFINRLVTVQSPSQYIDIELSHYTPADHEESLSISLSDTPLLTATKTGHSSEPVPVPKLSDSSFSLFPDLGSLESHNIIDHQMREKIYKASHWMFYVKWLYQHMTLVLFATQIPRLIGMYLLCPNLNCNGSGEMLLIVGIIFDIILLGFSLFCILVRMMLIKTFGIHVNITLKSLLRIYFTIILLIGILEFDIWLFTKDTANPAFLVDTDDVHKLWAMLVHFLFYSMATFTNVGAGDNISGATTGRILTNFGMLCGVIFSVVVFGVGLLHIGAQRVIATEKFVKEEIFEGKKKKSDGFNYNAMDVAPSSPVVVDMHQLVHTKSYVLRKQGLLPRAIKPMLHLATQHANKSTLNVRQRTCKF